MSIERDGDNLIFEPGPVDVHTHPRAFDAQTQDIYLADNIYEGKAGLDVYTTAMLASGITVALAMPNESLRLAHRGLPSFHESYRKGKELGLTDAQIHAEYESNTKSLGTSTDPYPISNMDRLQAFQQRISTESVILMGNHFGLDPNEVVRKDGTLNEVRLEQRFVEAKDNTFSLKLYGAETTGGYNVEVDLIPRIAEIWNKVSPEKPVVMHLEGQDVGVVLEELGRSGKGDIPVHIAHVSSRQELQAVIDAKARGQNVTCEVTPHHLYLDDSYRDSLGGYGCMKPSLKRKEDIAFIWANIDKVDMFASDCAPHRPSDKSADPPAFGVTNHATWIPLLLNEVYGPNPRLTEKQLDAMLVNNPRKRFNLPEKDETSSAFLLTQTDAQTLEEFVAARYVQTPFSLAQEQGDSFPMIGQLVEARAGQSHVGVEIDEDGYTYVDEVLQASYRHLMVPEVGKIAVNS